MSENSGNSILLFSMSDISKVQGSTEEHYVVKHLSQNNHVHLFSPTKPDADLASFHRIPESDLIPSIIWRNLVLLLVMIYAYMRYEPNTLYTYKGIIIPPWVLKKLTGTTWIIDLRTAPTGQEKEFAVLDSQIGLLPSLYWEIYDIIYKITLPSASYVVTLSEELRSRLEDDYEVNSCDILLVPLGVDTNLFDPDKYEHESVGGTNLVYIGSVSRFREIEICLKVLANFESNSDITLHIVGEENSNEISELRAQAKELNIADQVELYGYVNHSQVPKLLSKMDLALSPLPDHESYKVSSPAKIYEYLAMGLPVVCSDIITHQKILQQGSTGFFYQPGDIESLNEALQQAIGCTSTDNKKLRAKARSEALSNNWESKLKPIYNALSS